MTKNQYIQIRVTDELKEKLQTMAVKKCLKMSQLITQYISNGLLNDERIDEVLSSKSLAEILTYLPQEALDKLKKNKGQ